MCVFVRFYAYRVPSKTIPASTPGRSSRTCGLPEERKIKHAFHTPGLGEVTPKTIDMQTGRGVKGIKHPKQSSISSPPVYYHISTLFFHPYHTHKKQMAPCEIPPVTPVGGPAHTWYQSVKNVYWYQVVLNIWETTHTYKHSIFKS